VPAVVASAGRLLSIVAIAAGASACSRIDNQIPAGPPQAALGSISQVAPTRTHASQKIQHVVIIIQENRSFNNLFYGYPGATTATYGYNSYGNKITLKPIGLETTWDLDHSAKSFFAACNGQGSIPGTNCQMNGFNNEDVQCGGSSYPPCPIQHPQYAYVPHSESKPYFTMAQQYVLADQMYASNLDGSSFVSHQYIIAAQALSSVNYPTTLLWGCPGGPSETIEEIGPQRHIPSGEEVVCWDPTTLGDELDNAGISWGYYAWTYEGYPFIWSAYQAINHIYNGPDWSKDIVTPPSQILTDISNGQLRSVSWVTPTGANSDHAGWGSKTGPSWVASVVNAIGKSKYWKSTAIFIFWDDYGGWYDPEPPAYVDYDGLGIRIPMLIISPYAKQGYVTHVNYEHGSILKFTEDIFGLGRLSASDTRATSPTDAFDFTQPPRKFKAIPAAHDEQYFLHQAVDDRPPDSQ
jgi:phospholipase C